MRIVTESHWQWTMTLWKDQDKRNSIRNDIRSNSSNTQNLFYSKQDRITNKVNRTVTLSWEQNLFFPEIAIPCESNSKPNTLRKGVFETVNLAASSLMTRWLDPTCDFQKRRSWRTFYCSLFHLLTIIQSI